MGRNRIRKTTIGLTDETTMKKAVKAVMVEKLSVRKVSEMFGISKSTLHRYVSKCEKNEINWGVDPQGGDAGLMFKPNYNVR